MAHGPQAERQLASVSSSGASIGACSAFGAHGERALLGERGETRKPPSWRPARQKKVDHFSTTEGQSASPGLGTIWSAIGSESVRYSAKIEKFSEDAQIMQIIRLMRTGYTWPTLHDYKGQSVQTELGENPDAQPSERTSRRREDVTRSI